MQSSMSKTRISRLPRKGVIHYTREGPPIHSNLGRAFYGCLPHRFPPSLRTGLPRLIKSSQLWKGRAVEDALPREEGGAVELDC